MMRRNYSTAYTVIVVLEALGWIMAVVAVLIALKASFVQGSTNPADFMIPLILLIAGIAQVAGAQITRAIIATAEDSERAVELLERIEGRLADATAGGGRFESAIAGSRSASGQPAGSVIKRYKGRTILRAEDGVKVEGEDQVFANVIAAERFIDGR